MMSGFLRRNMHRNVIAFSLVMAAVGSAAGSAEHLSLLERRTSNIFRGGGEPPAAKAAKTTKADKEDPLYIGYVGDRHPQYYYYHRYHPKTPKQDKAVKAAKLTKRNKDRYEFYKRHHQRIATKPPTHAPTRHMVSKPSQAPLKPPTLFPTKTPTRSPLSSTMVQFVLAPPPPHTTRKPVDAPRPATESPRTEPPVILQVEKVQLSDFSICFAGMRGANPTSIDVLKAFLWAQQYMQSYFVDRVAELSSLDTLFNGYDPSPSCIAFASTAVFHRNSGSAAFAMPTQIELDKLLAEAIDRSFLNRLKQGLSGASAFQRATAVTLGKPSTSASSRSSAGDSAGDGGGNTVGGKSNTVGASSPASKIDDDNRDAAVLTAMAGGFFALFAGSLVLCQREQRRRRKGQFLLASGPHGKEDVVVEMSLAGETVDETLSTGASLMDDSYCRPKAAHPPVANALSTHFEEDEEDETSTQPSASRSTPTTRSRSAPTYAKNHIVEDIDLADSEELGVSRSFDNVSFAQPNEYEEDIHELSLNTVPMEDGEPQSENPGRVHPDKHPEHAPWPSIQERLSALASFASGDGSASTYSSRSSSDQQQWLRPRRKLYKIPPSCDEQQPESATTKDEDEQEVPWTLQPPSALDGVEPDCGQH